MKASSLNPYLEVDLGKSSTYLYLSEDRPEARGVLEQIDSRLRTRRKTFAALLLHPALLPSLFAVFILFPLWAPLLVHDHNVQLSVLVVSICVFFAALGLTIFLSNEKYPIVIPKLKSDAPSFWERNWEKIVIAVLGSLVGFALGWLARFLPGPK